MVSRGTPGALRASAIVGLLLTVAVVYGPSVQAGRVYEDARDAYAVKTGRVAWTWPGKALSLRSLGGNTAIAHGVNVALHMGNGLMVAEVAAAVVAPAAAFPAAAVFLLTTANSEAVNYLHARSEVLVTTLILLGVVAAIKMPSPWALATMIGVALVAPLVDETGLLAIPILALALIAAHGLDFHDVAGFTALPSALAMVIATPRVMVWVRSTHGTQAGYPWSQWIVLQVTAIARVCWLLVDPRALSIHHDVAGLAWRWNVGAVIAATAVAVAAYIAWRRQWTAAAFALTWFLIAVSPRLLIRTTEWVSEHQMYLAMAGLSVGLGAAWATLAERLTRHPRPHIA